jgi:hypothetical protein
MNCHFCGVLWRVRPVPRDRPGLLASVPASNGCSGRRGRRGDAVGRLNTAGVVLAAGRGVRGSAGN